MAERFTPPSHPPSHVYDVPELDAVVVHFPTVPSKEAPSGIAWAIDRKGRGTFNAPPSFDPRSLRWRAKVTELQAPITDPPGVFEPDPPRFAIGDCVVGEGVAGHVSEFSGWMPTKGQSYIIDEGFRRRSVASEDALAPWDGCPSRGIVQVRPEQHPMPASRARGLLPAPRRRVAELAGPAWEPDLVTFSRVRTYGLTLRPAGFATLPPGWTNPRPHTAFPTFGIVTYPVPLPDSKILNFNLVPMHGSADAAARALLDAGVDATDLAEKMLAYEEIEMDASNAVAAAARIIQQRIGGIWPLGEFDERAVTPAVRRMLGVPVRTKRRPRVPEAPGPAWSPQRRPEAPGPRWFPRAPELPARGGDPTKADLWIAHSAEAGTTIETRNRAWNDAIENLRMGFKWWSEGRRWWRQQSRGRALPSVPLEDIANKLRRAGAVVYVEPVEAVSEEEATRIRREHLEERASRVSERAVAKAREATARWDAGGRAVEGLEPGQPIMVGHHSEKAHRRALERSYAHATASVEAAKASEALESRAERLEARAAALAPERIAARMDANAHADALAALVSKNLKRDAGLAMLRKTAASAGATRHWHIYTLRYPPGAPEAQFDGIGVFIDGRSAGVGRGYSQRGVPLGETPEATYAALLSLVPHAAPPSGSPTTPGAWADTLAAYARRRLRRDTGAAEVTADFWPGDGPQHGWRIRLFFPSGSRWVRIDGYRVWVESTAKFGPESPSAAFDGASLSVEDAYRAILATLSRQR